MSGLVELRGEKTIQDRLRALGVNVGPAVRIALEEASGPVAAAARGLAPIRTGALAAAEGYIVRKGRFRNSYYSVIGPKGSGPVRVGGGKSQRLVDPRKYGHLVEQGTAPHSLATAVNMKLIRRGLGPWTSLARAEGVPDSKGNVLVHRRARQMARDYLYRRDKARGLRVHPGTRPRPFLKPALEAQGPGLMDKLRMRMEEIIRAAGSAA